MIKKVLFSLMLTLMIFSAKAVDNTASLKAMYIYNFLRHVNWPNNIIGNEFVIGVFGSNDLLVELKNFTKDRKIGNKNIVVSKIENIAEAAKCQLLFVSSSRSSSISEIKNLIGSNSCLIVSEKPGTFNLGSGIEFYVDQDKLKFKVSEANIRQQKLEISKALIDMAA